MLLKSKIYKFFLSALSILLIIFFAVICIKNFNAAKKEIDKPTKHEIKIKITEDDDSTEEPQYAEGEYPARFRAPNESNPYYYSVKNVFYDCGFGIPNCTAYAWGRAYELLKEEPSLCTRDAGRWYEYNIENNIYPYGKEPKLGAICCWDNEEGGHVAVVEKIEGNIITLSNSAYMSTIFFMSEVDITEENLGYIGWEFQGFIYVS